MFGNALYVNSISLIMGFCGLTDSKYSMVFSSLKGIAPISLVLNDWIETWASAVMRWGFFYCVHCDLTKNSMFE